MNAQTTLPDSLVTWHTEGGITMPALDLRRIERWLQRVAEGHSRILGPLAYVLCDDETILRVNREFLQHDYYTDIITFDETLGRRISGTMYISLDTIATNATLVGQESARELLRVIVHGVLHLCGIDDKGPGEREVMEAHEDAALALYDTIDDDETL